MSLEKVIKVLKFLRSLSVEDMRKILKFLRSIVFLEDSNGATGEFSNRKRCNKKIMALVGVLVLVCVLIYLAYINEIQMCSVKLMRLGADQQYQEYCKLDIEKGKCLGAKYPKEEPSHPLFQFVCWKFNNGITLTRDMPIDCDCTVFAEYKIDSAVKKCM